MYRRYTLDEVKRRIINILRRNNAGMSGIELANKTGINRMTITKYLDVLSIVGAIRKKKVGSVNVWSLEPGIADFEFPLDYLEIQQKFINAIMIGNENLARNIIMNIFNSDIDRLKLLLDVILPTVNTINELYNRGKVTKTERIYLLNMVMGIADLIKFNLIVDVKPNAHVLSIAGSENGTYQAKIVSLAFQVLGWYSNYIGNVEPYLDPFYDIDFQRFVVKSWRDKIGLMIIYICSSEESSLRFLGTAALSIRTRVRGQLRVIVMTTPHLESLSANLGVDYIAKDMQSSLNWSENELKRVGY